jgi:hypothetical protein
MSSSRNGKGFAAEPALAAALAAAGMLACTWFLYSALIHNGMAAGGSAMNDLNRVAVEAATLSHCADAVCVAARP